MTTTVLLTIALLQSQSEAVAQPCQMFHLLFIIYYNTAIASGKNGPSWDRARRTDSRHVSAKARYAGKMSAQ